MPKTKIDFWDTSKTTVREAFEYGIVKKVPGENLYTFTSKALIISGVHNLIELINETDEQKRCLNDDEKHLIQHVLHNMMGAIISDGCNHNEKEEEESGDSCSAQIRLDELLNNLLQHFVDNM